MSLRRPPYVFTQEGIAMLSSVLRSERAASVIEVLVEDIDRLGRKIEKVRAAEPPYARQRIGYITDNEQDAGRDR
jgi:hypothetical protein